MYVNLISDVITNVFEALCGNPALDHQNNVHEYDISRISRHVPYHEYQGMFDIVLFLKKTKGLFIWEVGRDVCRNGTFAGTGRFLSLVSKLFIWEAGRNVSRTRCPL